MTLTRYRNRLRVLQALEAIEAGEPDLAAHAARLGFADHAHLTRTMRQECGRARGTCGGCWPDRTEHGRSSGGVLAGSTLVSPDTASSNGSQPMIARIWDARTASQQATRQYRDVFEAEVLEHLSRVAGFRGAYLLGRQDRGFTAVRTLTLFESLKAVREFAGDRYERERVTPQARAALLDSDPVIQHCCGLREASDGQTRRRTATTLPTMAALSPRIGA